MPDNPALPMCPNCLRPLLLPPGYAGPLCPGHAHPPQAPSAQAWLPFQPEGSSSGQQASRPASGVGWGQAGSGGGQSASGAARPPRPPSNPIQKKAPSEGALAALKDWVSRFKTPRGINLPDKAHFFRLLDAMKEAGVRGKVKDAIDQVPPEILYPVLVEIGQLKSEEAAEAAGKATIESRPLENPEAPKDGPTWPAPGSPCGIEDCKETAVDWRKQKDGIPVAVCKKHAGIIDEKRKASADRNREVK